jgi:hypothetical protein
MSTADCPDCGGQGVVYGARCERCDGTGRVTVEPELDAAREARRRRASGVGTGRCPSGPVKLGYRRNYYTTAYGRVVPDGLVIDPEGAERVRRHRALDGRPLPLPVELAPWRPAPVRRLGLPPAQAHGTALARRPAGQAERRRPRPQRRAPDGSSSRSTGVACTSRTRSTRAGTTSSIRSCAPGS